MLVSTGAQWHAGGWGRYRAAIVLGAVQGATEFLPVSSAAHLRIVPWLLHWDEVEATFGNQTFDVALHMGTLLALTLRYGGEWIDLVRHVGRPESAAGRLFWQLVVASVPGAVIGAALERYARGYFDRRFRVIGCNLVLMGVALEAVDRWTAQRMPVEGLNRRQAVLIGISQGVALVPGVSRSGATMMTGRALGLTREGAARFSFLLAMPVTFGAGLLKLRQVRREDVTLEVGIGIATAAVVGRLAIGGLLRFLQLRRHRFLPFAVYRAVLGTAVVAVDARRRRQ
ncbi:MAG: undecaprenyl-diphosphatase UppP [Herpetosiphon sp.]